MRVATIAIVTLSLIVGACATKRHGRAVSLTPTEAKYLDCRQIEIELDKNRAFLQDVAKESSTIDGRALLGILGDFGIGNAMETSDAAQSGAARDAQLRALGKEKGCAGIAPVVATPATSSFSAAPAYAASGFAAIADSGKLPAGAGCKKIYEDNFLNKPFNRAIALSGYAASGARWCTIRANRNDAAQVALADCNKIASEKGVAACKLYAVNNDVVWVAE